MCQKKVSSKSKTIYSVFVGLCLVFAFPQSLAAFELFGIHLWGKKKPNLSSGDISGTEKFYQVEVVVPQGAPQIGAQIVKDVSSLVADQDKAVSSSSGLLAKARSNYQAILSALYADGRYGGVISIKINGLEVADLSPITQLPVQSTIVITVDAGPQYVFSAASITQTPPLIKKTNSMPSVKELGYKIGAVAKSETIFKAERWVIEGWRRHGHAKVNIVSRDVVADHTTHLIDAQIVTDPGQKAYYGSLSVRNVSEQPRVDSDYVKWITALKPGQQYNSDALAKANKRLARLDVFRAVNIQEADAINSDGSLPLTLVLEERKPRRFGVGGSYSTLDGAGFEAYWMHNNLFGHAERLKIETKISGIGDYKTKSYNPKNFNYLFGTTLTKPGVITPDTDFETELKMQRDSLDNYTTQAIRGKFGLTHIFNDNLSGKFAVVASNGQSHDDYLGSRDFTMVGLQNGLIYDSRDNKFNATKGLYGETIIEPLYEAHANDFVTKITIEGRSYWVLDEQDRFVFATRTKLGTIIGSDKAKLPSDMLFFAGGGGSVRGYAYHNIGIKAKNDTIIGGHALVEGSAELRLSVNDTIGLVSFIDGGLVREKAHFDFSQDIKWGVGIGGRYMTGLGPLRFDLAWPLKREKGDPRLGFYVGIGQAF
ncbi:autotransporter assembly complex protein TamA [Bartonella schoenbuchensis]|uniref:autotransporter assembly complex protein TamA n=1 Tax=Bartonella schoenbuchensis TaxID=165694 RepID=UPI003D80DCF0